jgi:hypothetical protein
MKYYFVNYINASNGNYGNCQRPNVPLPQSYLVRLLLLPVHLPKSHHVNLLYLLVRRVHIYDDIYTIAQDIYFNWMILQHIDTGFNVSIWQLLNVWCSLSRWQYVNGRLVSIASGTLPSVCDRCLCALMECLNRLRLLLYVTTRLQRLVANSVGYHLRTDMDLKLKCFLCWTASYRIHIRLI